MTSHMLTPENAIFLIIDLQEKLLPKVFEFERATTNCILLIKFARITGIPLLVTTQYERGLGPIVEEIKREVSGITSLDKVEFGCFDNDRFLE
ncbi:MAG: isochorismatase family protein, partial [Deltaproteobacteria bacterium]|nr:isochorismatase family protein [Deltaproteobacteria bacterium]